MTTDAKDVTDAGKAQSTALPWRIANEDEGTGSSEPEIVGPRHVDWDDCEFVAVVCSGLEETDGNAHFIVRACNVHDELVEALEAMDALVESLWDAIPWGDTVGLDVRALNEAPLKAKAALARARGETTDE